MIRFDPTIIIQRVVIERNGAPVYDEIFHVGMNIIRGDNSSGKSTLLNFIFYGLGGDLTDWSEIAKLCTRVVLEVEFNGSVATLSREISTERGQPMEIFGGNFLASVNAPRDKWIRYPYARSENKESFSQAILRLLGIPEVANETSGNLTIHQILRLLYADQLSPVESLFKFESQFDPPSIRDAVGRLLCGANDPGLYANDLKIRLLQRDFDAVNDQMKSLFSVLGKEQQGLTSEWLAGQRSVLNSRRINLQLELDEAERKVFSSSNEDELTLKSQNDAYETVKLLQESIGKTQQQRDALEFSIADSAAFITSLEKKLEALKDSTAVSEYLGKVHFQTCPSCYAALEDGEDDTSVCHLCRTPFDAEMYKQRIVALTNDTAIQLKQSKMLQERRVRQLPAIEETLSTLQNEWTAASRNLSRLQRLPSTDARNNLRNLSRQAGYLDREIENLEERAKVVELISQLSEQKTRLNAEITSLKSQNDAMRASQAHRLSIAYTAIADEIRFLLQNDLRRQDSFEHPKSIEFDFGANRISVDGQTYFSASSRVILKSSFHLGFLAAATKHSFFRHPRFCVIDTIEDKGMEVIRSHNLQHQIAKVSETSKVQHQIIFATTMIAPELDEERFTIGKYSTRDDPTLAIKS